MALPEIRTEQPLSELEDAALNWRPMTAEDLDAVAAIAVIAFPDHFEGRPLFENRLALHPQGCFVLANETRVGGYLIAYPWRRHSAPPLNTLIEALPDQPELIYLHDLALHPEARGGGYTRTIVERLADQSRAAGWPALALVAVNDAAAFWRRQGFEAQEASDMAAKLASYGDDARYMVRRL